MRNRIIFLAAVALLALTATAAIARNRRVAVVHWGYSPGRVVIQKGDTVTWVWRDGGTTHNVYSPGFRSSPIKSSGSWTVRFNRRGTFGYTCTVHPWMTGTVVVH